jgi:hypothetical protein
MSFHSDINSIKDNLHFLLIQPFKVIFIKKPCDKCLFVLNCEEACDRYLDYYKVVGSINLNLLRMHRAERNLKTLERHVEIKYIKIISYMQIIFYLFATFEISFIFVAP